MATLVPQGLLRRLKAHFRERIEEAVQRYRFNDADEDSLTGALGHALSTPERIVTVANGVTYSFATRSAAKAREPPNVGPEPTASSK